MTAPRAATGGVSPVAWIGGMAAAGARLDAYAHNPYALSRNETPFTGGCDHCDTLTMATLPRLVSLVTPSFGPGKRIWLTEFGYQTNPPDPYLGVARAKQATYISQAALRAYMTPRIDMLIQFLIQDEPDIERWQSGVLTAAGKVEAVVRGVARCPSPRSPRIGLRDDAVGPDPPGQGRAPATGSSS